MVELNNGKFVVVGNAGVILTTTDGVNYTEQYHSTSDTINQIAYGNGIFVAVTLNGRIFTSPNGTSWTTRTSGTNESLNGITFTE